MRAPIQRSAPCRRSWPSLRDSTPAAEPAAGAGRGKRSMTGRAFVDTNVWVYAVDSADPAKQQRARAVLAPSGDLDLVVSAQVLGEFYVTITRKFERRVEEADAVAMLDAIRQLPVVAIDGDLVAE